MYILLVRNSILLTTKGCVFRMSFSAACSRYNSCPLSCHTIEIWVSFEFSRLLKVPLVFLSSPFLFFSSLYACQPPAEPEKEERRKERGKKIEIKKASKVSSAFPCTWNYSSWFHAVPLREEGEDPGTSTPEKRVGRQGLGKKKN